MTYIWPLSREGCERRGVPYDEAAYARAWDRDGRRSPVVEGIDYDRDGTARANVMALGERPCYDAGT